MKISVCVECLYGKKMTGGIAEVAAAGLPAIEFWGWTDKDVPAVKEAANKNNLSVAAMCTRDFTLNDPEKREEYLEGIRATIPVANLLGCKTLITQVGMDTGESRWKQHDSIVIGLLESTKILNGTGITLVIEPLNLRVDHAGYYLSSSDEAYDIVKCVNSSSVRMLFDIYHQQITEGDVIRRLTGCIDAIGHFHAAGNPGRHELDVGEMNYEAVFRAIQETGYTGYVGLEYMPSYASAEGLGRVKRMMDALESA